MEPEALARVPSPKNPVLAAHAPLLATIAHEAVPHADDAALLKAVRAGDKRAFRSFVEQYQGLVFAFLSRTLGRSHQVEDLAQEVFVRAYRGLATFDGSRGARLSTWLLTIARNASIDAIRRAPRHLQSIDDVDVPTSGDPSDDLERRELAAAITRAAEALSHDQREVLVLAEFHGLSMDEIAGVVGAPVNTVKQRLFRARERMRAMLGPWFEEAAS